jgi:hypothetical protein
MIGTIRKHSALLWWSIIPLTIISFVVFMGSGPMRSGSGSRRGSGYGTIYGKPVTAETYAAARNEFFIYYWLHSGAFPDKDPNFKPADLERETYVRLMLTEKARALGIHVSEEALVAGANELLRSLGRSGQAVPMSEFLKRVLQPEGLDVPDFQRFVRDDLVIQQLVQTLGLAGALVPPQEAGQLYDREHQEVSAQAVFFSATNYLAQVAVTPAAVAQFYSNNMAVYREPDRVQVNYLAYDLTNYFAAAEQKLGKTNIASQAEAYYAQHGLEAVPDAKTPEEAKAKIRELILRQGAQAAAGEQAKQFVTELFAMDPVSPENLVTLAKKNGLAVRTTAPFAATFGPEEFPAPAELTKIAFKLDTNSPFSKPIAGPEAVYVIGLAKELPSAIQPLDQIHARVVQDFQNREAALFAQRAGTNFYHTAAVQMAAGKTFAQAAVAAGQAPQVLTPFSLSSTEVPEAGDHAELNQLKQAAFTTPAGRLSNFFPTADGGFILFVQSLLPMDEGRKNTEMPQFLAQVRRGRENEAFNLWLQTEANRELGGILKELSAQQTASGAAKRP